MKITFWKEECGFKGDVKEDDLTKGESQCKMQMKSDESSRTISTYYAATPFCESGHFAPPPAKCHLRTYCTS